MRFKQTIGSVANSKMRLAFGFVFGVGGGQPEEAERKNPPSLCVFSASPEHFRVSRGEVVFRRSGDELSAFRLALEGSHMPFFRENLFWLQSALFVNTKAQKLSGSSRRGLGVGSLSEVLDAVHSRRQSEGKVALLLYETKRDSPPRIVAFWEVPPKSLVEEVREGTCEVSV